MSFLLDTDICSAYMKGNTKIHNRFIQHGGNLRISVVTMCELYTWTFRAKESLKRTQGLLDMLNDVEVLDVTSDLALKYGETEAALLNQGHPVTEFDLLIATTAIFHNLTLVTHNVQDFRYIPGLRFVDWLSI